MKSLNIEPARDGGYIVRSVNFNQGSMWEILLAGSLEKCVEYIRNYYFVPAMPPTRKFGDFHWVGKYEDQHDPFSKVKA